MICVLRIALSHIYLDNPFSCFFDTSGMSLAMLVKLNNNSNDIAHVDFE